jgi:hypothetical protein
VLLGLRLAGLVDWPWWIIAAPYWIPAALLLQILVYGVAVSFVAAAVHVGRRAAVRLRRRRDAMWDRGDR